MTNTKDTVANAISKKLKQSETFSLYLAEKRWRNHSKRLDISVSNKDATRAVLTDFNATLDVGATEKCDYSVDNHVVTYFFVVHGWRKIACRFKITGRNDATVVSDCYTWIFFGDAISKLKKMIAHHTTPVLGTSLAVMIPKEFENISPL